MSDFGQYRYPKAAKPHKCEWCGEPIPKGETHIQFAGIWEGAWHNWRMHNECFDAADRSEELQDGFTSFENERPAKVTA
jgi:hypothetical protein